MGFLARAVETVSAGTAAHLRRYGLDWACTAVICLAFAINAYFLFAPPTPFPRGMVVILPEHASARAMAGALYEAGIVRHQTLLAFAWRALGQDGHLTAGAYRFDTPVSLLTLEWRIAHAKFGIAPVRITFPEGITVLDMAKEVSSALPEISADEFISVGMPYEGYLFPNTYLLQPSATAGSVVADMRQTFNEEVAPLAPDIAASGHSWSDIIIMASIIEREAARPEDRRMISGILWNRIEKRMPLQVDAVFGYIESRQTYSPSYADLGVDSPYNTYTHAGLPPGPICNPSLDAIEAAIHPTKSKYLYYLTGKDGNMYYATTYTQHKANLAAYLK